VVVFAKAPVAGTVKTRLIPAVGATGAAALHLAFVDDVCRAVGAVGALRVLSIAGDYAHPALLSLARREGMEVARQPEGDLGARMEAAIASALDGGAERVVIVGGDVPAISPRLVEEALALLRSAEVVLGPADDGGYYLVGARRRAPWLFADVVWGSPSVLDESLARLRARGVAHGLLPPLWDVDEPADLERLRAALVVDPALAPATRAALASAAR
jgi:rSAM/selenodomain-associated transferase 1